MSFRSALSDVWRWLLASGGAGSASWDADTGEAPARLAGNGPLLGEIILRSGFAHVEVWPWCNDADRREAPA